MDPYEIINLNPAERASLFPNGLSLELNGVTYAYNVFGQLDRATDPDLTDIGPAAGPLASVRACAFDRKTSLMLFDAFVACYDYQSGKLIATGTTKAGTFGPADQGSADLGSVPPGDYRFIVTKEGYRPGMSVNTFTLGEGSDASLDRGTRETGPILLTPL